MNSKSLRNRKKFLRLLLSLQEMRLHSRQHDRAQDSDVKPRGRMEVPDIVEVDPYEGKNLQLKGTYRSNC